MKYKIKITNKKEAQIVDEFGNLVFTFHGDYLCDLFKVVEVLNKNL